MRSLAPNHLVSVYRISAGSNVVELRSGDSLVVDVHLLVVSSEDITSDFKTAANPNDTRR